MGLGVGQKRRDGACVLTVVCRSPEQRENRQVRDMVDVLVALSAKGDEE